MKIDHKSAYHDYEILDEFEAGVALIGPEVKSIKLNHASLEGSFVKLVGNNLYLLNAQIYPYEFAHQEGYDPKRSRRLLLHKKEIISIRSKIQGSSMTLIPLAWYTKKDLIKLKIALARGKKEYQKKEKIKRRDIDRDTERILRGKVR
ncbi:SsrA-binding protein [Candidatus Gottesmanbacteria bacterium RIFCSPHIGHO2_02_FULL_39_11]|uniref:SsrA-binding protein n=1 Tax=Candidatus Gottesmanbacteria bacterium RIFCSPHIGHO2_02_FULL_39_11 TaxID=1798382 RepID=A0A1F5ZLT2_9BACT|nr:MAG: SsrA-binding protein [Candidatus Gottesmanbacteria bacterium RIFCSPHIGHO2_02_FULL_39_11]